MQPDPALVQPCSDPTLLPDRELTQVEVERYWRKDRASLIVCKDRHSGLIKFYKKKQER